MVTVFEFGLKNQVRIFWERECISEPVYSLTTIESRPEAHNNLRGTSLLCSSLWSKQGGENGNLFDTQE